MRTAFKKALLLLSILLPFTLSASVSPNNARKANRIYFDSVRGNGGTADWKMCRLDPPGPDSMMPPG